MVQPGYAAQWGSQGRDDLGAMKAIGANAVRLYHSMGTGDAVHHGEFLDRAAELGMNVFPGMHTDMPCKGNQSSFDCYDAWRAAVTEGLANGFKKGDAWHPAVATVILMNEPDFFGGAPQCQPAHSSKCRVRAVLSAMDGLLSAEKDAGVSPGRVNLTVTWSFAMLTSIDGKLTGPGVFGFQDMVAGIADPSIADYKPRMGKEALQEAFRTRWVNALNAAAPYSYIQQQVDKVYKRFEPTPWFIGEHGMEWQTQAAITDDMVNSHRNASADGPFNGLFVFQFQQAFEKSGSELNFGIFNLGDEKVADTDNITDSTNHSCVFPVYCLKTALDRGGGITDGNDHRAEAVAKGWNGSLDIQGICKKSLSSSVVV